MYLSHPNHKRQEEGQTMLPEIRTSGEVYSIPQFNLDRNEVEDFFEMRKDFQAELRDFFYDTIGQFSQMKPKSIEAMALNVEGAKVRERQRFISEANGTPIK